MKVAPDFHPRDLWARFGRDAWGDERRLRHTTTSRFLRFDAWARRSQARKAADDATWLPRLQLDKTSTAPAR